MNKIIKMIKDRRRFSIKKTVETGNTLFDRTYKRVYSAKPEKVEECYIELHLTSYDLYTNNRIDKDSHKDFGSVGIELDDRFETLDDLITYAIEFLDHDFIQEYKIIF